MAQLIMKCEDCARLARTLSDTVDEIQQKTSEIGARLDNLESEVGDLGLTLNAMEEDLIC